MITPEGARPLSASIEISAKQALESHELDGLFPAGTRVYIADLGIDPTDKLVAAAKRIHDFGYSPVPHFASRRLTTREALDRRLAASTQEAGVRDVLVVGGGLEKPAGEFSSTMAVLETGLLDKYGVKEVGVAGHPEGSPDFSLDTATEALRLKQAFGDRTGAALRIVTQFGFNSAKLIEWSKELAKQGIELPVHAGVAGPAKITTLIKYAAMCGVGNSINFLKRNALSITALASSHSPETFVGPVEAHVRENPSTLIHQWHVFPFGGIAKSAEWLRERGSWPDADVASGAGTRSAR